MKISYTSGFGPINDKTTGKRTTPLKKPITIKAANTWKKYLEWVKIHFGLTWFFVPNRTADFFGNIYLTNHSSDLNKCAII